MGYAGRFADRITRGFSAQKAPEEIDELDRIVATRTSFVSRFIVLREGRRSRAHRIIEQMDWDYDTTAEELAKRIREAFIRNGDKLEPVERDLRRALEHAKYSVGYFLDQYLGRSCLNFRESLCDYERSNQLLFGINEDDLPRKGGWRLSEE